MTSTPRPFWTVAQIATLFQVGPETVRTWLRDGKFPNAIKTTDTEKGQWRIPNKDVVALANKEYGSE